MNHSTSNSLPLRAAITGFLNYKTAAGLSQRSVDAYKRILEQWADYVGNKKVAQFTDRDINAYLVYMRTEYVPRRFGGDIFTLQSLLEQGSLDMVRHYARIAQVDVEQAHRKASSVNTRFSNNSSTKVVSIPNLHIGEMRQFC